MNSKKISILFFLSLLLSCTPGISSQDERTKTLYKYAYSSCIFWYFKEKGYDAEDIRSVNGGIVETSQVSLDKFQEISLFIKDYTPSIQTKNNIDQHLAKCFYLEDSKDLSNIILK